MNYCYDCHYPLRPHEYAICDECLDRVAVGDITDIVPPTRRVYRERIVQIEELDGEIIPYYERELRP